MKRYDMDLLNVIFGADPEARKTKRNSKERKESDGVKIHS